MKILDSLLIALFLISVVFAVLLLMNLLIKLFSLGINRLSKQPSKQPTDIPAQISPAAEAPLSPEEEFSSGKLRLKDVDEPTAAMIMAIVSDESGIPLSELCFKSIKLVKQS